MSERDILITAVSSLTAVVVALFWLLYNHLKETNKTVTEVSVKSTTVIEHNTRAFEKLIGEIQKITEKTKR